MIRTFVITLLLSGCLKEAEQRALAAPDDPEVWERLGNAYRMRLQRQRAADAYQEALALDPSRTYLTRRLPRLNQDAIRTLRRDAMSHPNDDEIWGDLGDLLLQQRDELGARQAYLRAFRLDPADSEWHGALIDLGAGDAMLEHARSALDETDDESLGDVGDLLAAMGRVEEACDHWRRAAALDPGDGEWAGHAETCGFGTAPPTSTSSPSRSTEDVATLEAERDADVDLLMRLGEAYQRTGDTTKARDTLWSALLLAPTDTAILHRYLAASGSTARRAVEKLLLAHPEDPELCGVAGDLYLELGIPSRARAMYERAHELAPEDPRWKARHALFP